jgi:hypothetical protein
LQIQKQGKAMRAAAVKYGGIRQRVSAQMSRPGLEIEESRQQYANDLTPLQPIVTRSLSA